MTVVDVWKQPVVKLINFLAEFFWIQVWCIFWLEWPELNLQVIGQTMVIIVYRFFSLISTSVGVVALPLKSGFALL